MKGPPSSGSGWGVSVDTAKTKAIEIIRDATAQLSHDPGISRGLNDYGRKLDD
jgi:hypothetical protein